MFFYLKIYQKNFVVKSQIYNQNTPAYAKEKKIIDNGTYRA